MTDQTTKSRQKRLHNCVLNTPKWAKINENLEKRAYGTLKINDLIANAAVKVANADKKGQLHRNANLLGKYRFNL